MVVGTICEKIHCQEKGTWALRILSGPLLYDSPLYIKFASRDERIMVEDEPRFFADMHSFEIFFLLNRI